MQPALDYNLEITVAHVDRTAISWSEIGKHNKKSDCWIVIDGWVYDVSDWVDHHPGGQVISSLAGEDASAMFHSSHFRDISDVLQRYKIGYVRDHDTELEFDQEFLRALKQRVLDYFTRHNIDYRATKRLRPQIALSIIAFFGFWYITYLHEIWLGAIAMGLISCAMVGGFAHEYAHSTLTKQGNQSNLTSLFYSSLWSILFPFMFEKQFQYEHFKHHMSPMNDRLDYEVYALRRFLRLADNIPRKRFFRHQKYYAPLVYAFYITIQVIDGLINPYFAQRQLRKDPAFWFQMYGATSITIFFHILIPVYYAGWMWWLGCFVLYSAIWQFTTYMVAAVVHMTEPCETNSGDWVYRVCYYTKNVLCGNPFYDWLSGGFNYQIDHHLLPSISREHLPRITHIVRQTCREFGYPYHEYRSLWEYLADHYSFLATKGAQ